MQQPALFMPARADSQAANYDLFSEPVALRFNAAELDVGYEVAFPFLSDPPDLED